jgi:hypothetical protein
MFGVVPDKLTIALSTNHLAEVSGQKDGKGWKKAGEWRVVSGKVVLFLEQDDLPGFIFRTDQRSFVFDPWAKSMMSELKPPQFYETEGSDAFQKHYPVDHWEADSDQTWDWARRGSRSNLRHRRGLVGLPRVCSLQQHGRTRWARRRVAAD